MRIKVNNHYIGLDSANQMIYPGVYSKGDPLLYGLEADLIEIGYAEWVDPEEAPGAADDLSLKTVAQLQALAKERGIDASKAKKKDDYIALLAPVAEPTETKPDDTPPV